jgi:hypothetical protein
MGRRLKAEDEKGIVEVVYPFTLFFPPSDTFMYEGQYNRSQEVRVTVVIGS